MISVALADDQALVRAGFGALLDAEEDIEVVGEAAGGEEAVFLARRTRPDVATRAMTELGARDRSQLVVLAYESGLLRPGWVE